jgi:hypothetical protein
MIGIEAQGNSWLGLGRFSVFGWRVWGHAIRDARTRLRAARPSSTADSRSSSASSTESSFRALSSSGVSAGAGAGAAAPSFVRLLLVPPLAADALPVAGRQPAAGLESPACSAGRGGPSRTTAEQALAVRLPAAWRGLEGSSHCACRSCPSSSGPRPCSESGRFRDLSVDLFTGIISIYVMPPALLPE